MSRRIAANVVAGLVTGLLTVTFMFSYAAAILPGELAEFVPRLTGHFLLGAAIIAPLTGLRSGFDGLIAIPQEHPTAAFAAIVAALAPVWAASVAPEGRFVTVLAMIVGSTLVAGGLLWFAGRFRLAHLVHYIPYPVVVGFLTATGWLLLKGAVGVMTGIWPDLADLGPIAEVATLWIPGLALGAITWFVAKRLGSGIVAPIAVVGSVALFYAIVAIAGWHRADAVAGGWLLEPFAEGALITMVNPAHLEWGVLASEAGGLLTVLVIAVVAVMMNLSGLSAARGRDVDLDRELRVVGGANVIAGAGGSLIGYHHASLSRVSGWMSGDSWMVSVVVSVVCGAAIVVGSDVLSLIPRFVLGGMLVFVALTIFDDWLFQGAHRLASTDLLVVLAIVAVAEVVGLLEAVAAGLAGTVAVFLWAYSRIDVVRSVMTGAEVGSTVERPIEHQQYLSEQAGAILYVKLQGFLFFATSVGLLARLRREIDAQPDLTFLVLDFRHVTGIDSSALHDLTRLKSFASRTGLTPVVCGLDDALEDRMRSERFPEGDAMVADRFPTADDALEWCEDHLLERGGFRPGLTERPLDELLEAMAEDAAHVELLRSRFERIELDVGEFLVRAHAPGRSLFFVERGLLTVLADDASAIVRLRRATTGSLLGLAAFFRPGTAEALVSIRADTEATVHRLTKPAFEELCAAHPRLAVDVQSYALGAISERLASNLTTFERLLSEQ